MNAADPAVSRGFLDATVDSVGLGKEVCSEGVRIFYYLLQKMEVAVTTAGVVRRNLFVQTPISLLVVPTTCRLKATRYPREGPT